MGKMVAGREAEHETDIPDMGYSHGSGGQGQMDHAETSLGLLPSATATVPKRDKLDGL